MSYPANNFDTGTFAGERWQPAWPVKQPEPESLAALLRLQNLSLSLAISDADRVLIEQRLGQLRKARVNELGLQIGDRAPRFEIQGVQLDALLEHGPVVLSFFLGHWCPYCTLTYRAMREWSDEFEQYDARWLGVSSTPSGATSAVDEFSDEFLADVGNRLATQFGLTVPFTDDVAQVYRKLGFDVPRSPNSRRELMVAIPATYVIDTQRVIRFAFINPDYRRRAEPAGVVDVLQRI